MKRPKLKSRDVRSRTTAEALARRAGRRDDTTAVPAPTTTPPPSAPLTGAVQENVLTLLAFGEHEHVQQLLDRGVRPELFDNDVYRRVADRAIRYFETYDQAPKQHIADLLEKEMESGRRSASSYEQVLRDLHHVHDSGFDPHYILDRFDEFLRQQRLKIGVVEAAKLLQTGDATGAESAMRSVLDATPTTGALGAVVVRADQVPDEDIIWLWDERIPRGKLSVIAGEPGLGKSFLTLDMAARVSTGRPWPGGFPCPAGHVVLLSAEDDPALIRRRLRDLNADLSRVHIVTAVRRRSTNGVAETGFSLEHDLTALEQVLARIADVALVVIDPITAYLGRVDSHKNSEIRALLAPLSGVAAKHKAAVVVVSHFTKGAGANALNRVIGSLAFVAAARTVWAVVRDPEIEARRLFLCVKNNLARDHNNGLAFIIKEKVTGHPRVAWYREAVEARIDDVLREQHEPGGGNKTREAVEWLRDALRDGARQSEELSREATAAGITDSALKRAKHELNVQSEKAGFAGGWSWRLPE